jgi:hypothetical protein
MMRTFLAPGAAEVEPATDVTAEAARPVMLGRRLGVAERWGRHREEVGTSGRRWGEAAGARAAEEQMALGRSPVEVGMVLARSPAEVGTALARSPAEVETASPSPAEAETETGEEATVYS